MTGFASQRSRSAKIARGRKATRAGQLLAAAVLGLTVLAAGTGKPAQAGDDEDENVLLDTKIMRSILGGLGLRRGDEPNIDYRERSPLVLPRGADLPPPEKNNATKTAGWPDDPDVKRARALREAERKRQPYVEGVDDRPLLPSEYENPTRVRRDNASGRGIEESSRPSTNAELGVKSIFSSIWSPKEEYTTFSGEPPRASLIEPPSGYRTPSPNQPYGIGKQVNGPYKEADRQEPVR